MKTKPTMKSGKCQFSVTVPPQHCEALDIEAARQFTSRAAIVRQAVALWVAVNGVPDIAPRETREAA